MTKNIPWVISQSINYSVIKKGFLTYPRLKGLGDGNKLYRL